MLLGPILSSADVVQHALDFDVAKRFLRVVREDQVLCVSRTLADVASTLLMLLPLPHFLADPRELGLLP